MRVWPSLDMNVRMFAFLIVGLLFVQPLFAQKNDCACETAPLPEVLATVNGTKLRTADVFNDALQKKVADLQQGVIDERKNMVRLLINSRLLEAEARKRGMSPTRLVKQEVMSKVADPTDAEITEFYNRNRSNISSMSTYSHGLYMGSLRYEQIATVAHDHQLAVRSCFGQLRRSGFSTAVAFRRKPSIKYEGAAYRQQSTQVPKRQCAIGL